MMSAGRAGLTCICWVVCQRLTDLYMLGCLSEFDWPVYAGLSVWVRLTCICWAVCLSLTGLYMLGCLSEFDWPVYAGLSVWVWLTCICWVVCLSLTGLYMLGCLSEFDCGLDSPVYAGLSVRVWLARLWWLTQVLCAAVGGAIFVYIRGCRSRGVSINIIHLSVFILWIQVSAADRQRQYLL